MLHSSLPLFALGLTILLTGNAAADSNTDLSLFSFKTKEDAKAWRTVNDGVMGGVSEGNFRLTETGTMEFYGSLSLKNNGGFASVRSRPKKLELQAGDTIVARVRGDGRQYYLNLYVPGFRIAYSWRAPIQTKENEWMEVRVPLKNFYATSFGRKIGNAGSVDADKVNALGFLLSDKKEGRFKLEVEWIKADRFGLWGSFLMVFFPPVKRRSASSVASPRDTDAR